MKATNRTALLEGPPSERARTALHDVAQYLLGLDPGACPSANLSSGAAGIALFHVVAGRVWAPEHVGAASRWIERTLDLVGSEVLSPSLHGGFGGAAWVLQHASSGHDGYDDDAATAVDDALLSVVEEGEWSAEYDLLQGLVGFGVYALERLPRAPARALLGRVIQRLAERASPEDGGLVWKSSPAWLPARFREGRTEEDRDLGVAHGVAAIVPLAAAAVKHDVESVRARALLDGAVTWLLAQRLGEEHSASFPSILRPGEPRTACRSGWCYGDPGIAAALLAAADAVGDAALRAAALSIARRAARRPLHEWAIHDAGFCHGAAGAGHVFNRLFRATGDPLFAEIAGHCFARLLALRAPVPAAAGFLALDEGARPPAWRADDGLLEGVAGVGLALLSALSPEEPTWDRVFLLSVA